MNFLRSAYYALPPVVRRISRRFFYMPIDLYETFTGTRDPMIPPRGKIFIGSGDFASTGESIRDQLVELGGLQPHNRVLDIGCGVGRVAVPLTGYLDGKGSYEGFDIVKSAIRWCRKRIQSRFRNFRFTHIDLKNDLYNLRTDSEAKDFAFPYSDEEFDLVFLTSVFTHMVLDDVDNYLKQIYRVLKPGGVCFATFFIMNEDSQIFMKKSGKKMFETRLDHHYLFHAKVREANVAYDEKYLTEQMIGSKRFNLEQVHYGFWSGRPKTNLNNFQDIYVFRKF
ncbi:MAG: class I SAM-dependent methyltransferase [Bacteroidales bacterium]|nr:class I SAM-dependent methyltransferase [Bacteroidales bacterium]